MVRACKYVSLCVMDGREGVCARVGMNIVIKYWLSISDLSSNKCTKQLFDQYHTLHKVDPFVCIQTARGLNICLYVKTRESVPGANQY